MLSRVAHTLALAAALAALLGGIARDHGAWASAQRAILAYLIFYIGGGILFLLGRMALEPGDESPPEVEAGKDGSGTDRAASGPQA